MPAREVLLIAEVFIGDDEDVESRLLRSVEQVTVAEATPAHILRRADLVRGQRAPNLDGHALVEENPHAAVPCSIRSCP